jgi:hypothetical protein
MRMSPHPATNSGQGPPWLTSKHERHGRLGFRRGHLHPRVGFAPCTAFEKNERGAWGSTAVTVPGRWTPADFRGRNRHSHWTSNQALSGWKSIPFGSAVGCVRGDAPPARPKPFAHARSRAPPASMPTDINERPTTSRSVYKEIHHDRGRPQSVPPPSSRRR